LGGVFVFGREPPGKLAAAPENTSSRGQKLHPRRASIGSPRAANDLRNSLQLNRLRKVSGIGPGLALIIGIARKVRLRRCTK
jgi:hypothetical protein